MTTAKPSTPSPWFLRPKPVTNPKFRLFCFPYAGGAASIYHQWPSGLPADIELVAVQYPGRGTRLREAPMDNLNILLDGIETAIAPLLDRPFAFFGHSMGATVAFELTRRLQTSHKPLPKNLFISGRAAPHMPPLREPIHLLSDADFMDTMRDLNGTPSELLEHRELMEMMLPMIRADFKALETWQHQPSPPFDIPLSAFGGLSDPGVSIERLDAWDEYTTQKMKRHLFPGDHFFLHQQQLPMLNIISRAIASA